MMEADLIRRHPRLFHMAEDGSWPSIAAHGLLSAARLCDLYGIVGLERAALLSKRRPKRVALVRPDLPGAVLRDQSPMHDTKLLRCLADGLAPADWYKLLNGRVFFWLDRARLERLLGARAYRHRAHLVLTIDTARLLAVHRARVTLSAINSGATLYVPQKRGRETFRTISNHPDDVVPVELTIDDAVPDIAAHIVKVERWIDGRLLDL